MFSMFSALKKVGSSVLSAFSSAVKAVKNIFTPTKPASVEKATIFDDTPANDPANDMELSMLEYGNKSLESTSSSDTQELLNRAANDAKMTKAAYDLVKPAKFEAITSELSANGVNYLTSSYDLLGRNNSGKLQAAIFEEADRITVAIAGTRQNSLSLFITDLVDDVRLAFGFNTAKASSIDKLNAKVLELYGHQIAEGKDIHYTGHSLGGHSANVAANDMAAKLIATGASDTKNVSATTFDSAGGDTALKNSAKLAGHNRSSQEFNKLYDGEEVIIDSRPNAINSTDSKTTAVRYTVQHEEHGTNGILKYNPVQLIAEHSLDNFVKALSGKGGVVVGADGKAVAHDPTGATTPVSHDSFLFQELRSSPVPVEEDVTHKMTHYDPILNKVNTISFTAEQLAKAQALYDIVSDVTDMSASMVMVGPDPMAKLDMVNHRTFLVLEDGAELMGAASTAA